MVVFFVACFTVPAESPENHFFPSSICLKSLHLSLPSRLQNFSQQHPISGL